MVVKVRDGVARLLGEETIGQPNSSKKGTKLTDKEVRSSASPTKKEVLLSQTAPLRQQTLTTQQHQGKLLKFKSSSQRGTFHGTYKSNSPKPHDTKVRDLLLEIERESKVSLQREGKMGCSLPPPRLSSFLQLTNFTPPFSSSYSSLKSKLLRPPKRK